MKNNYENYEITYQVKVIVYASSEAEAVKETTELLHDADSGVADFAVGQVKLMNIKVAKDTI